MKIRFKKLECSAEARILNIYVNKESLEIKFSTFPMFL